MRVRIRGSTSSKSCEEWGLLPGFELFSNDIGYSFNTRLSVDLDKRIKLKLSSLSISR